MASSPSPGRNLASLLAGRYAVTRKLGSGGTGSVYLVDDLTAKRHVALKLIGQEQQSPGAILRLQEEFRALAALRHPQIAAAYDFGYAGEKKLPFYTREYVAGTPLEPGPPPPDADPAEYLAPLLDLLDALHYLHAHGVLHLDVHAGNLILADDKRRGSVLIDLGIIRSPAARELRASWAAGSTLPPEFLAGDPSPATDIYMAGRLLLHRLTGRGEGEPTLPRELPGWGVRVTLELERIVQKAIEKDPGRRFSSALELREALVRTLGARRSASRSEPRDVLWARSSEVATIEEALRGLSEGKSAIVWFTGGPGMGKTRLLAEARMRAQLRGIDVAEAGFQPGHGPESLLEKALAGHAAPRRSRRSPPHHASEGVRPQDRARKLVSSFLARKRAPLLFLLDDADRADGEDRRLVDAFLEASAKSVDKRRRAVAILGTSFSRPARLPPRGKVCHLRPLSSRDSAKLLQTLLAPARLSAGLAREAFRCTGGVPAAIRRVGCALRDDPGRMAGLLETALPPGPRAGSAAEALLVASASPADRDVLLALWALGGSAREAEIAAALDEPWAGLLKRLRGLTKLEFVGTSGGSRDRTHHLRVPIDEQARLCPPERIREMRLRTARFLSVHGKGARDTESRARLLLSSGSREEAFEAVLAAARELREQGHPERASAVLEEGLGRETDPGRLLALADEAGASTEESGDHARGIRMLEPLLEREVLPGAGRVRLRRRLGVHYHRAGRIEDARRAFARIEVDADPTRDIEDLVLVDSEIAELETLRGDYDAAEAACRRGIARLEELDPRGSLASRMGVMLRASLGHLHLRCMRLESARDELHRALELAGRHAGPGTRAAILNNLALVENYLNRPGPARRAFSRAERLLLGSGAEQALAEIACNLALLGAKAGDREEAWSQLRKASDLSMGSTSERIDFFVAYTRGVVAWHLGDAGEAVQALEQALPMGRRLGDVHLVQHGEVYLADAQMACGRYGEAVKTLRKLATRSDEKPTLLRRMTLARSSFLETLLGRDRRAERALKEIRSIPRTGVPLIEAWNDVFLGFQSILAGGPGLLHLGSASEAFKTIGIPAGERFVRAGLVLESLLREDRPSLRRRLRDMESSRPAGSHRVLDVLEPILDAEASLFLGDAERARDSLARASAAMVGVPFLELDGRIELLRARLERRRGDVQAARRHLQRSLSTRDLVIGFLPRGARKPYLGSERFRGLDALSAALEGSPRLHATTPRLASSGRFEGMIGPGPEMTRVFHEIENLRDQDMTVLIVGETGTGKELAARAIHATSSRKGGRFLAIHCAALPPELFEAELFGYEAGSFTGAEETHPGILESLEGGTLLFDEVSELPASVQAKLLHVLESGTVRRLGGLDPLPIDVRFLASTERDLETAATTGGFRPDLYYRLRGFEVRLPPLRSRRSDMEALARHFLEAHAARLGRAVPVMTRDALALLEEHSWPGNVRELESVILRALIAAGSAETLGIAELRPLLSRRPVDSIYTAEALEGRRLDDLRKDLERAYLTNLFRKLGGDPEALMKALGIKRSRLYAWMRKLELDPRKLRAELEG